MELEPYFVKALKLLHSKHPDSSEQLRQMLFDVLVHKKVKTEGKVQFPILLKSLRIQCKVDER